MRGSQKIATLSIGRVEEASKRRARSTSVVGSTNKRLLGDDEGTVRKEGDPVRLSGAVGELNVQPLHVLEN